MKQRRTDKEIVQKRAVETREKLLKSALELYTVKGYHSTTVDEIAKNAGLSTGVAYRYFKNKKDLLLEAISYGLRIYNGEYLEREVYEFVYEGVKITIVFGKNKSVSTAFPNKEQEGGLVYDNRWNEKNSWRIQKDKS